MPSSLSSLEDLGLKALDKIPDRSKTMDTIHAFQSMKEKLKAYLKPFAGWF